MVNRNKPLILEKILNMISCMGENDLHGNLLILCDEILKRFGISSNFFECGSFDIDSLRDAVSLIDSSLEKQLIYTNVESFLKQ